MILPKERDLRLVTIRRGGTLTDDHHRLLALWSAECAEHVLPLFTAVAPEDLAPLRAIQAIREWAAGKLSMTQSRAAGGNAMGAVRELEGAARFAAYAAGQAACVAHVAAHDLGAAAYAIKAVQSSVAPEGATAAGKIECAWQRSKLPDEVRELVLDDQFRRNTICWNVFDF